MKVTYIDHCGSDLSVVNAARVSFDKYHEEFQPSSDAKLINFLAREGHTSPFNHTFITMHIKAPLFVARQLVKHKFMPWNEVSRRYVDDEPEFYEPELWRGRSADKKQGSTDKADSQYFPSVYCKEVQEKCLGDYKKMLAQGIAPEQARMILPLNTYTQWYWSGTLGAWAGMYNLRAKPDTQKETQEIAFSAGRILADLYPVSWKALTEGK